MNRPAILALAAAAIMTGWSAPPAGAAEAPWCAVISTSEDSVYWDCQYRSFEECQPHVLAGNRGWCNPSPYYVPGAAEQKRPGKRRAHTR
ncbi:MAG TPA: DUF3551 domain-containing protein [Pseudolabrys sp.]|nr:DUF3551 domain-containing protein [Pseudolabrys sp.]